MEHPLHSTHKAAARYISTYKHLQSSLIRKIVSSKSFSYVSVAFSFNVRKKVDAVKSLTI